MKTNVVKHSLAAAAFGLGAISLVACGGSGSADDDDGPPIGTYNHYVSDSLLVPTNATEATNYGLDLDDDASHRPDNALGNILSVLAQNGGDVQMQIDEAITMGDILILHSVQATDLVNATRVGWRVLLGDSSMITMPPAYDGSDMFTVDVAGSPESAKLTGQISGGQFKGGPAEVTIPISLVEGGEPVALRLVGTKIEATVTATTCDGKLGGALTKMDLDMTVIPTIADLMSTTIADDPGCQMMPPMCGSTAQTLLDLFDKGIECDTAADCPADASMCTDDGTGTLMCTCGAASCGGNLAGDLEISVAEIQNNSLIKSLLTPDVDLLDAQNQYQADPANRDGVKDSLSLGVKFTCVGATFTVAGEQ